MKRSRFFQSLCLGILGVFLPLLSQSRGQGSALDYARADELRERFENKVFRSRIDPQWLEGNRQFWYRVQTGPDETEFVFVDAEQGVRKEAFDHQRLAKALGESTGTDVAAHKLPFRTIQFVDSGDSIEFAALDHRWNLDLETYTLVKGEAGETAGTSVEVLERPARSERTGRETHIQFVNRMEDEISLFWLDQTGERISYGEIAAGGERRQHTFAGHVWLVTDERDRPLLIVRATDDEGTAIIDATSQPRRFGRRGRARNRDRFDRRSRRNNNGESPDEKWRVRIDDHNLHLVDVETNEALTLTTDGSEEDPYVPRFYWSPDSRFLVGIQERKGEERQIHLIESAPEEQLQPKLHTLSYAKPGDEMPVARPRLFDIQAERPAQVAVSEELFPNAWQVSEIRWRPDSTVFTFLYNQRGHQVMRIIAVDAATGETRAIINEECDTFFDYAHKKFTEYLDETNEIIWMSERDGWNHLYLYDAVSGTVKNQITQGEWVVRTVERVDESDRQIWFWASGIRSGQDPYYLHLCRINFDGSGLTILTEGDGTHRCEFSPTDDYFIDRWSRVDHPPVTELRRSDNGALICLLESADWSSLLEEDWQIPERFVAKGRDGETDIYGVIYRPTHFNEKSVYPIIEAIYAGPQSSFVPKDFSAYHSFQSIAELGFIIVKLDGMGTSHRSKAFHDVCWKNLGDSGFPDRILWIKAAAERYPYMDINRVGLFGGSAGGQSALRGLLAHGDFYSVGAADCGCHDNRMDKIWWNELWMGWPMGEHYEAQSNVTQAHRLTGKLLLTVGGLDRNVDPASTMQVVDALIEADKDFELIVFPGRGHGAGGGRYGERRRNDFFVRHLLGREPRWLP